MTQVFRRVIGGDQIVGVVGQLQLDVLKTRLEAEYQVVIDLEPAPFETARWISADSKADLESLHGRQPRRHGGGPRRRAGVPGAQRLGAGLCRRKRPKIKFADIRERS